MRAETFDHGDLIILTSWMVSEDYDADSIAEAVRKPWDWADELEQAKADLTGIERDANSPRVVDGLPVEDPKPCPACDGCGMIANTEAGEPWTAWADLQPPSNIAVVMGLVSPIACPACSAAGVIA